MNMNATLIGQSIAFAVFVLFCMKFVWPQLLAVIEERQKKIADGLAASDEAEIALKRAMKQASEELDKAKVQAVDIIDQAKKRATQIVDEGTQNGHDEREKIIGQGKAEIEAERNRAKEELRKQVANLAVVGAERILSREIDSSAHSDIVEKLVTEL